jgi:hypothetical protein
VISIQTQLLSDQTLLFVTSYTLREPAEMSGYPGQGYSGGYEGGYGGQQGYGDNQGGGYGYSQVHYFQVRTAEMDI